MIVKRFVSSNEHAAWLVEGWIDKKMDMNCQVFVSEDGNVEVFSIKEQVTTDMVYVGSVFPPRMTSEQYRTCYQYAKKIGQYLYEHSFCGVFGIDGLIKMDGTVIPIIEINGRFTLSTYVSFLDKCFKNRNFFSFYKRATVERVVNYEMLVSELKKREVYIDEQSIGLFIYTAATLETNVSRNIVRIFCVACGNTMEEALGLKEKFDKICNELKIEEL